MLNRRGTFGGCGFVGKKAAQVGGVFGRASALSRSGVQGGLIDFADEINEGVAILFELFGIIEKRTDIGGAFLFGGASAPFGGGCGLRESSFGGTFFCGHVGILRK